VVLPAPLSQIVRGIGAVSTAAGIASAVMILTAVSITCQMIWVRFVLNGSTVWQTEAVIFLVIGATLVGLPYVQLLRGHVNVDLVPLMLPHGLRQALAMVTLLLTMALIGVMAWYGFELFEIAHRRGWRTDTVWGPKLWVPYLAMPVGFGLYLLQLVADLIETLFGRDDVSLAGDFEEDY
jgi:TRAP-type C4-dicarboxylate transport system permease small subunit